MSEIIDAQNVEVTDTDGAADDTEIVGYEQPRDIPYAAIDPGTEDAFMIRSKCPVCGRDTSISFAELMRCARNDDRPRPVCECGHVSEIGHMRRFNEDTMEWEDA